MRPAGSIQGRTALLAAALILVGVMSVGVSVGTQVTVKAANERALRARTIQAQVKELQIGMVNQQTALRGYVLTGSTDFLQPYDLGRTQVVMAERGLDRLLVGQSAVPSYSTMKDAATRWEAWADALTATIEAQGAGPVDVSESFQDRTLFGAFRTAADRLDRESEMVLVAAEADANAQSARLLLLLPSLGVLGLTMLLLLLSLFFRSTLLPLGRLIEVAGGLARSEKVSIPGLDRRDEVGSLARALAAWDRASYERLALAQSMLQLTEEVKLERIVELGIQRLREVLVAAEVVMLVRTPDGYEVAAAEPHDIAPTWDTDAARDELWRADGPVVTDLRADEHPVGLRRWVEAHGLGPCLAMPMVSGGRPLGRVLVLREAGRPGFNLSDVELAQVIVPALGAAVHVSRLFMDLTRANIELAHASRVKSQFLANMSHELRTPLNSVLGFAQLLESPEFGPLNERQRRYVRHISSSGQQLLELINDVLDLSKIEAGKLEISPETTELEPLVEECAGKMRPLAASKRIELCVEVPHDMLVWSDPRRLRQVILNLLSNGVKFTPEKGRVTVRARCEASGVWLTVTDTGIGIADEHRTVIFDEFTQIDSTLSRQSTGSGLGLPLSRRLVELMGGSIAVESRLGLGSTFTVRLPTGAGREGLAAAGRGNTPASSDPGGALS